MKSKRLSIPRGTIYDWVSIHRTPYVKAGPSLRFDPDDVIRSLTGYPKTEEASLRDKD
jgi:hypothetical protein